MPRDKTRTSRRKPRGKVIEKEPEFVLSYEPNCNEFAAPTTNSFQGRLGLDSTSNRFGSGSNQGSNQNSGYQLNNGVTISEGRSQYIDPAAFGLVDPDVQHYFKNLERAIDVKDPAEVTNGIEDVDLFIENAFDELADKEFTLVVDKECSRVLEKLLSLARDYRVVSLLSVLVEKLLTLITHRFASHVCQTLLVLSAKIIQKEVQGIPIAIPEDKQSSYSNLPTMTQLIHRIVQTLQGRWSEMVFNQFASHFLRVLLQVLHGSPLEQGTKSFVQSKSSKEYMASKSGSAFNPISLKGSHLVPDSFHGLLIGITNELVLDIPDVVIRSSVLHQTANPLFQALLLIKAAGKNHASIDTLVDKLLMGVPSESEIVGKGETLRNPFVQTMLKDPVGSHLLEIILKTISDDFFHRIYLLYFRSRMVELSFHHVSNFIVQELLVNARSPVQLQLMSQELAPELGKLLRFNRSGVIRSLVEGCLKLNSGFKDTVKSLGKAFFNNLPDKQNDFIYYVLLMQDHEGFKNQDPKIKPKYHEQGSLLLQKLLQFPDPHNSLVINSFLAQPASKLLDLARDKVACHVIEKILTSPEVSLKVKRRTLRMFDNNYHLLATDATGSRVLDKCWAVADINTKEAIAVELVQHESMLASNFYGKFVLRNCRIDHFKRKRAEWKSGEESADKKKNMFRDILGDEALVSSKTTVSKLEKVVDNDALKLLGFGDSEKSKPDGDALSEDEIDGIFTNPSQNGVAVSNIPDPQLLAKVDTPEPNKKSTKKRKRAEKEALDMVLDALKTSKPKKSVDKPDKNIKKEKKEPKEKKDDETLKALILESNRSKAPKSKEPADKPDKNPKKEPKEKKEKKEKKESKEKKDG